MFTHHSQPLSLKAAGKGEEEAPQSIPRPIPAAATPTPRGGSAPSCPAPRLPGKEGSGREPGQRGPSREMGGERQGRAGRCRNAPRYKRSGRARSGRSGAAGAERARSSAQPSPAQLSPAQPGALPVPSGLSHPARSQVSASRPGTLGQGQPGRLRARHRLVRNFAWLRRSWRGKAQSRTRSSHLIPRALACPARPAHDYFRED